MSYKENYNFLNYTAGNIEYKKPIFTKNPIKRTPIIENIKIKKPIILPTYFNEIKVINPEDNYTTTNYDNTYIPSIINQTENNNNEYFTT